MLPGESQEEHYALLLSLAKDLKPQGPIEAMYVTEVEWDMRRLKRIAVAEHAFITDHVLELAARMGGDESEGLRMLALGKVLAAMASESFDGIEDKLTRQRKRIREDIKENLEALLECQLRRSINVQSQLSERRMRVVEGPRLLTASMEENTEFDVDNGASDGSW